MQSDVVWSINIMIGLLLIAGRVTIYWIFKYDDWNPNPSAHSHIPSESEYGDSGDEKLGVGEE